MSILLQYHCGCVRKHAAYTKDAEKCRKHGGMVKAGYALPAAPSVIEDMKKQVADGQRLLVGLLRGSKKK